MLEPIKHVWGVRYSPEQVIKKKLSNYTSFSQRSLDRVINKLHDRIKKNEIVHLKGFEMREFRMKTSDIEIENYSSLINGCLVTYGNNKGHPYNQIYIRICAEPSNEEGFNKTLKYLSLSK